MNEILAWCQQYVVTIAAVLTACGVIYKAVGVPLKKLVKGLQGMQDDVSDLMWDRLAQGHDYYMRQGWATSADKERMCIIYNHYKSAGRNHLADTYEHDIMGLPEHPPERREQA